MFDGYVIVSYVRDVDNTDQGVYGEDTSWLVISAEENANRTLLASAKICYWLAQHRIGHAGVMDAEHPYAVRRSNQSGSFMLACLEGQGEVFIDGRWIKIRSGEACLLAPYMANAFRCIKGENWKFVWVRYEEDPDVKPLADSRSPVRGKYDSAGLQNAVMGLYHETAKTESDKSLEILWSKLIHDHVLAFAKPKRIDERLWRVWSKATEDLSLSWTLGELADIGFMSEEHLRRLCNRDLGRSPMQHLIFLRMIAARDLLMNCDDKIESVAAQVGYESGYTFSNTFKKWMGCRPSDLRVTQ